MIRMRAVRIAVLSLLTLTFAVATAGAEVHLTRVQLFSTGVGQFVFEGTVTGDDTFEIRVPRTEMADLLKSMVVEDFDGGTVDVVRYDGAEALSDRLSRFLVNLNGGATLTTLADRAIGREIDVTAGSERHRGRLLGIENRDETLYLDLLRGNDGAVVTVALERVASLRFADESVRTDLNDALETIESAADTRNATVTFRFVGSGTRRVRIRFIRPTSVWKMSYRLTRTREDEALLQGWAIVENTSTSAWKDVQLELVSGEPLGFRMDLFSPLYRERPEIPYVADRATAPPVHEQAMAGSIARAEQMAPAPLVSRDYADMQDELPGAGFEAQATAAVRTAAVVYQVSRPVTVARGESAAIPVLQQSLAVEEIRVFNRAVVAGNPLLAYRFENSTGMYLTAGPATVFDGYGYGGDARFGGIAAGETTLASFAVDRDTRVSVRSENRPEEITSVRIIDGVFVLSRLSRRQTIYEIAYAGKERAELTIEHPRSSGWQVDSPSPAEMTDRFTRFTVPLDPRFGHNLTVVETRPGEQRISLSGMSDTDLTFYLSQRYLTSGTTRALRNIQQLRSALDEREQARRRIEADIASVYSDQERMRANMAELERTSSLYRRYETTMTRQEDRLTDLRIDLERARTQEEEARSALREYLANLNVR